MGRPTNKHNNEGENHTDVEQVLRHKVAKGIKVFWARLLKKLMKDEIAKIGSSALLFMKGLILYSCH